MDARSFLVDLLLPRLAAKFQMVALTVFLSVFTGLSPQPAGVLGVTLFLIAYFSTYFYNDLMDYEEDKKGGVYPAKLLVTGKATPREFFFLLNTFLIIGIAGCFLYSPALGLIASAAVFFNNVRTHVDSPFTRQALLVLVEILNFEAFWYALFGEVIPAHVLPLFLAYAFLYSAGHLFYKLRKKRAPKEIPRDPTFLAFAVPGVLSILLAAPSLVAYPIHTLAIIAGIAWYLLAMGPRTVKEKTLDSTKKMAEIYRNHALHSFGIGLFLLIVYFLT